MILSRAVLVVPFLLAGSPGVVPLAMKALSGGADIQVLGGRTLGAVLPPPRVYFELSTEVIGDGLVSNGELDLFPRLGKSQ